ncbi:MAG: glycosyltransferase [Bacteroidales bacterium]|nr:glycosyltransferase [Salinivirgaceae bacterium]MBR7034867.1 glycosyltransferase [Bacteroidales bacterium]
MRFSIIIPTYNRADFLPKAIESVLGQTFVDWELIIVDDGSTDNTKEVVSQYSDSRITYIYQENAERSAARNKGIAHSVGEYVLFLDSDDYYLYNFLNDLNLVITDNGNEPCLYFHNALIEHNGKQRQFAEPLPNGEKNILKFLFDNFRVIGVCQAAIARCFLAENMFDTRFSLWEDTHLFFRLLAHYPYRQLNVQGYVAVQHEQSTVIAGSRKVKMTDVERYMSAINDLENNYWEHFSKYLAKKDFENYRDSKLNMYLYMARTNSQFGVAYSIAKLMLKNRLSLKNVVTCLKLVAHNIIGR